MASKTVNGKKVIAEKDTRKHIIEYAKMLKCEKDVLQIFSKYDNLLKKCTNQAEREAIGKLGVIELHKFISSQPEPIMLNNEVISFDKK